MSDTTLAPLPRPCEAPHCVEGRIDIAYCDRLGDPTEPAHWVECPDCLGTGQLHINCGACDIRVPWSLTALDTDSGESFCPDCVAFIQEEANHVH